MLADNSREGRDFIKDFALGKQVQRGSRREDQEWMKVLVGEVAGEPRICTVSPHYSRFHICKLTYLLKFICKFQSQHSCHSCSHLWTHKEQYKFWVLKKKKKKFWVLTTRSQLTRWRTAFLIQLWYHKQHPLGNRSFHILVFFVDFTV